MSEIFLGRKIVYLGAEAGFEAAAATIGDYGEVVHVKATYDAVADAIEEADAVLDASMKIRITDSMVTHARNLKIISCATTGSDHIERNQLEKRSIPVHTLREDRDLLMNLTPAAELSWGLLLSCARKIPAALAHVRKGEWVREGFPGMMLHGRQLGLIGCGRIGGWMARYAKAFNMEVVGYDPYLPQFPETIRPVDLEELVSTSDCVSVHVHLTEETRGLVSKRLFEMIKPGAVFINTSRGAIADESALLDGLVSGRIGAAGLDVLDGEPEIDNHPLVAYARTHDNLIIVPHIGGFSPDAVRKVCARAAEKIVRKLESL